jgi:putative DNA primase/helicase
VKNNDGGINNDVARLAGARLVTAAELAEGKRLNETLVKDLTGKDTLTARYLYKELFEFRPVCKLWMYGNHKLIIKGTDDGIWRRVHLIPFSVTIPEQERDLSLAEKLTGELAGVLAWLVRGCVAWQHDRLNPPAEVRAATSDYRTEQDLLAAFLGECCITNPLATVTSGDLYGAYKAWAQNNSLTPMSGIAFSKRMVEKGFSTTGPDGKPRRDGAGRAVYAGLGLTDTAKV